MKNTNALAKMSGILLLFSCLLPACEKDSDDNFREVLETRVFTNQEIALNFDSLIPPFWNRGWKYQLEPGNRQVAFYSRYIDQNRNISDDEVTYELVFEFDPDQSSFLLQDSALWYANCLFDAQCFCAGNSNWRIAKGEISGQKLSDDTWSIDFDIRYDQFNYADSTYTEQQYRGAEVFRLE
ncbi:hypothetical protein [Flavilitoribacter nigricans]|uniref:Lipoprotein n=1 Tax=Flavilitoribacter nigricans (strain ATCC 23147 / DSM 23189 / NBRC 102662 / NCIMB 1420 / SS-2) TaxID=1122177 RepID=A0A2D0NH88_FLAN2|nr:hypothetical protein [Flavilitoribacter nigricans]PHN07539.1 hypothetical protein CRP01_05405 [Flavilitoribacter nigricans DSM 23189 = NBRC 102662]